MNFEHLRTFARAAEYSSFSKAADSLGLAQSSVSRIIGELESEWGGALFHRTGRGVELSEHGREALEKVRVLLRDLDRLSDEMRSFGRLPSGRVALGLVPSLIPSFLPQLLNTLQHERPGIQLRIYEGFGEQIERWISDGIVDVGLYSEYHVGDGSRETSRRQALLMSNSRLVLASPVGRRDLPKEIDFAELAQFPLVLPAAANGLRTAVDALCHKMSIRLRIIAEADSALAQKALAQQCGCFMLQGENSSLFEDDERSFSRSLIQNPTIYRHIVLQTVEKRSISRAARDVSSFATSILRRA